jgi:hypothetical protein
MMCSNRCDRSKLNSARRDTAFLLDLFSRAFLQYFGRSGTFSHAIDLLRRNSEEKSGMDSQRTFQRRRPVRGAPYSLAEFQKKYRLDGGTAEDLFLRFGPSAIELDLLMKAKRRAPSFDELTKDMPHR